MRFTVLQRRWALLACLVLPCSANAFFPFDFDDADTEGKGKSEIEMSFAYQKDRAIVLNDAGDEMEVATDASNTLLWSYTYGVTDNLDVFINKARQGNPYAGWLNTQVGAQWLFAGDQNRGWSFALMPSLILPVSQRSEAKGLGSAKTNFELIWISSYVSSDYELHFNVGYSGNRYSRSIEDEPRRHLWSVSVAPIWVVNEQWSLGVSLGAATNTDDTGKYTPFGQFGISYTPIKDVQVGLGVMVSPNWRKTDGSRSTTMTAGLSYDF